MECSIVFKIGSIFGYPDEYHAFYFQPPNHKTTKYYLSDKFILSIFGVLEFWGISLFYTFRSRLKVEITSPSYKSLISEQVQ
jgi:hypothetical protein